jgi:peptidoglycan/LPS O-acetylase OafA/YrhL
MRRRLAFFLVVLLFLLANYALVRWLAPDATDPASSAALADFAARPADAAARPADAAARPADFAAANAAVSV